jgi:hypothetical protein
MHFLQIIDLNENALSGTNTLAYSARPSDGKKKVYQHWRQVDLMVKLLKDLTGNFKVIFKVKGWLANKLQIAWGRIHNTSFSS